MTIKRRKKWWQMLRGLRGHRGPPGPPGPALYAETIVEIRHEIGKLERRVSELEKKAFTQ